MIRLLILGGTGEAAALAHAVGSHRGIETVTSLAGRAGVPDLPGKMRVGGFGGAEGLERFLRAEAIDRVIDATHPFAARISAHAETACRNLGIARLVLARHPWRQEETDRWILADDTNAAAARLPEHGRRAFLTVGAGEVAGFAAVPGVWFLVRLLRPANPVPLADYRIVTGRPPFTVDAETALLRRHRIDVLVTKESGGAATHGKIAAARRLGLPVVMIRRPPPPPGETVDSVTAAVAWLTESVTTPK